ncbi:MAG: PEP-CTERM sorting domain-containing protein [Pelomonas sp.]|nr:PEP-CTERM sorting domain-containing protein [Roseateles sp.]
MSALLRKFAVAATMSVAAWAAQAAPTPVTITFTEAGAPMGVLDGDTFYQTYGIASFSQVVRFGADSRLPDDGFGIYNNGASGTVLFGEDMSSVSMTWAVSGSGVTFHAEAYDLNDILVGSFSSGGVGTSGLASFAAGNVRKIVFHDGGAQVAIDTLNFTRGGTVPEPVSLALVGVGLLAAGAARRRQQA